MASCNRIQQHRGNVARSKDVRPRRTAGNGARRNAVNLDADVLGKSQVARFDLVERFDADGQLLLPGQLPEELPVQSRGIFHALRVDVLSTSRKCDPRRDFISAADNKWMADGVWQKRPLFLEWVEDAKAELVRRGGKGTKVEVAEVMGLAPNTMKKYTSTEETHQKPGVDALRLLGAFLGRDYRLLFDGPDMPPAGIDPKDWAEATEDRRSFAIRMFYQAAPLSKTQLDAIESMVKAGRELGRARRAAEAKVSK